MTDIEEIVPPPRSRRALLAAEHPEDLEQVVRLIVKNPPKNINDALGEYRRLYPRSGQDMSRVKLGAAYGRLIKRGELVDDPRIRKLFVKTAVRAQSGVSVIATMTAGEAMNSCSYNCIGCPDPALPDPEMEYEPFLQGKEPPRSYPPNGPCTARGGRLNFDPRAQFLDRAASYLKRGQVPDKIELKILGGTISNYPKPYIANYFAESYLAANFMTHLLEGREIPSDLFAPNQLLDMNETAEYKIVGVTIETRPDHITPKEIKWFIDHGGMTRLEMGIQHTDDGLLKRFNRMATDRQSHVGVFFTYACGVKAVLHLMLDLPQILTKEAQARIDAAARKIPHPHNSPAYRLAFRELLATVDPETEIDDSVPVWEKDLEMFNKIIQRNWGDEVKIYPHEAVNFTPTPDWYRRGIYKPYFDELVFTDPEIEKEYNQLIQLEREKNNRITPKKSRRLKRIIQTNNRLFWLIKNHLVPKIPNWWRVDRLGRDIPGTDIKGGMNATNIRQYLQDELTKEGKRIEDIRGREIRADRFDPDSVQLRVHDVPPITGDPGVMYFEIPRIFIEIWARDDNGVGRTLAYLRMSPPPTAAPEFLMKQVRKTFPELDDCMRIRQLEVLGVTTRVGDKGSHVQHRGFGSRLLAKAEEIAVKQGFSKMSVIVSPGARGYYRTHGYRQVGSYMIKKLGEKHVEKIGTMAKTRMNPTDAGPILSQHGWSSVWFWFFLVFFALAAVILTVGMVLGINNAL